MNTAQRHVPREVDTAESAAPGPSSLSERLADWQAQYVKLVSVPTGSGDDKVSIAVPFTPQFGPDYTWTAQDLRILNSAYVTKASANVSSLIKKGMSEEDKVAALTKRLNGGYQFSDEVASEFEYTRLQDAIDRALFEFGMDKDNPTQRVYSGDYHNTENSGSAARLARLDSVNAVMTRADLADKYEPLIRQADAMIMSERRPVGKRNAKGETAAKKIAL